MSEPTTTDEQFAANVTALEAITSTLQRYHAAGGFVYYGSDLGVLSAAILSDIEKHGLTVVFGPETPG